MSTAFKPQGGATLAITATTGSTRIALSTGGGTFRVFNSGTGMAFVRFGDSTVTAVAPVAGGAAGSMPIAPGSVEVITTPSSSPTHVAVIAPTGGGIVYFTPGEGI